MRVLLLFHLFYSLVHTEQQSVDVEAPDSVPVFYKVIVHTPEQYTVRAETRRTRQPSTIRRRPVKTTQEVPFIGNTATDLKNSVTQVKTQIYIRSKDGQLREASPAQHDLIQASVAGNGPRVVVPISDDPPLWVKRRIVFENPDGVFQSEENRKAATELINRVEEARVLEDEIPSTPTSPVAFPTQPWNNVLQFNGFGGPPGFGPPPPQPSFGPLNPTQPTPSFTAQQPHFPQPRITFGGPQAQPIPSIGNGAGFNFPVSNQVNRFRNFPGFNSFQKPITSGTSFPPPPANSFANGFNPGFAFSTGPRPAGFQPFASPGALSNWGPIPNNSPWAGIGLQDLQGASQPGPRTSTAPRRRDPKSKAFIMKEKQHKEAATLTLHNEIPNLPSFADAPVTENDLPLPAVVTEVQLQVQPGVPEQQLVPSHTEVLAESVLLPQEVPVVIPPVLTRQALPQLPVAHPVPVAPSPAILPAPSPAILPAPAQQTILNPAVNNRASVDPVNFIPAANIAAKMPPQVRKQFFGPNRVVVAGTRYTQLDPKTGRKIQGPAEYQVLQQPANSPYMHFDMDHFMQSSGLWQFLNNLKREKE